MSRQLVFFPPYGCHDLSSGPTVRHVHEGEKCPDHPETFVLGRAASDAEPLEPFAMPAPEEPWAPKERIEG